MIGKQYGRWTVIADMPLRFFPSGQKQRQWKCQCECGFQKVVLEQILKRGQSKSCGCYARESASKKAKTHGLTRTPAYRSWESMKRRINVPTDADYPNYGGRGIRYCERWEQFENFFEDMGERPEGKTLDRIDSNGDYGPSNCRWASRREQSRNRRPYDQWIFTKPRGRPPQKEHYR